MDKNIQKALKDRQSEADRIKKILQRKKEKAAQKAAAQAPNDDK